MTDSLLSDDGSDGDGHTDRPAGADPAVSGAGSRTSRGMSEFELIDRLSRFATEKSLQNAGSVLTGIGDDAAVVSTPSGHLLLTTDAIVDGVHFRSTDERWYDVGWKLAVSNLSDIAAMGGVPDHALVTLGVPKAAAAPADIYTKFYSGMNAAFERYGGRLVGGDVVFSPTMFMNLALTGHPALDRGGKPEWLRRDAALPGDLVCVTGPLGGSAGGLELLFSGETNPSAQILVDRHFHPLPRIDTGRLLVELGVKCAMDISDGLIGDLEKIARASDVGITVEMAEVPMPTELIFMFGTGAIDLALGGGEDYELAFTAPRRIVDGLIRSQRQGIHVIGHVTEGGVHAGRETDDRVKVVDASGTGYRPVRKGWDHLNG